MEWISDTEGLCECPGKDQHTTKNGKRDCIVFTDSVVTLSCFHAGCRETIEETNRKLRRAVATATLPDDGKPRRLTREEKERIKTIQRRERIRKRVHASRDRILANHRWPYEQIINDSPIDLRNNIPDHWQLLLNLFADNDVIWIGGLYDSGQETHRGNFRTKEEWLKESSVPGQFTCPSVFKTCSYQRGNDNIIARRFLVVESDELGKDEIGAVFRWLKDAAKMRLRCIVDTAGKSLHAWFDCPDEKEIEDLKLVLPILGCDPKLFTASQPVRMPSAARDGKFQRLVYLAKGGSRE
ncbi:MAG: hypothetical protein WC740_01305 [Verrucomicrobiia bacterium]